MSGTALSLYDHVAVLDVVVNTLAAMDSAETDSGLRAAMEAELRDAITGTREKIDRTAGVLASFDAAELAADLEIKRLCERKQRIGRERERLEGYVIGVLISAGSSRFEGFVSTLRTQENPVSVVVDPDAELPDEFLRTPKPKPPVPAPDKTLIKAALQRGQMVPGCRLEQKIRLVRS